MSAVHKPKELNKAVIYARYSSHGQQEQSIDGQIRDCLAFAEREGLVVVNQYIDRALSAKTDNRPEFRRMIDDASKKQFQYVIVWKLDRFARNRFDSAVNKATLKKHGVKVLSAMENIADNPEGALLEGILESMAEHYSASLSENVRRGQRESMLKGAHIGGVAPYGFKSVRVDGKLKLVADEEKAEIVKYVFEEYAKGVSKKEIIDSLNARGVRNANGKPLGISFLQRALHNTKYIGKYRYNGEVVEGACDAIISDETFFAVQRQLNKVKHAPAVKKARQEYLLQGKAFCGHCGARLVGDGGTGKLGKVYYYYACGKRKKHHTCDKMNEKKDFLEWYVVEQTVEYVLTPERIDNIAASVVAEYEKEFSSSRIKKLERDVNKIDIEVENLIDILAKGEKKSSGRILEKIDVLETKKADIELNLTTLRIATGRRFTKEDVIKWLKSFCRGDELDIDFQRRIIDLLINSIYLYDDKLVIYYNISGGKQITYIEMCNDMEKLKPLDDDVEVLYNAENTDVAEGSNFVASTPPSHITPKVLIVGLCSFFERVVGRGGSFGIFRQIAYKPIELSAHDGFFYMPSNN